MARTVFPREFYIPAGSVKVCDKHSDAVAYIFTNVRGRLGYMVFVGKQAKPIAHYTANTSEDRASNVAKLFASNQRVCNYKANLRAAKNAYVNDWAVGQIVNTCWGYDETHKEFYEVVASTGMTVTLRQVRCVSKSLGYDDRSNVAPVAGDYKGEAFKVRAQKDSLKVGSHRWAHRTDSTTVAGIKIYAGSMVGGCH